MSIVIIIFLCCLTFNKNFVLFRKSQTAEQYESNKSKSRKRAKKHYDSMPIREKLDRAAKSNGARDLRRQAEDEITAEDRRKFEAAQKKKLRIAP